MKRLFLTYLLFATQTVGLCFASVNKDQFVQTWIISTKIKPVGAVYCDGVRLHQVMALIGTFITKDGEETEKEIARWDQLNGKDCTEDIKARGTIPEGPNKETLG
jgi:hypothetical protein